MVYLGLGLLIASASFLWYRHSPVGWWGWWERMRLVGCIGGIGRIGRIEGVEMEMEGEGEGEGEIKEQIEREMEKQRERKMEEQRQREMKKQMEREMKKQMEREMEKQREMEMKEQREREMEKQRQREMENQREMEKQMEREMEMEKQRERVDSLMENHEREKKKGEADELPANVSTSNYGMEREKEKSAKMHESINAPNFQATEPLQDTTTTRITSGHLTIPPPNKAALDRAAMPPPPFLKKSVPSPDTPSSPSTSRAKPPQPSNAYNTPAQTLDGTSASTLIPEPEQIPSFPAANSAQRASNGPRTGPRLNALPNFTSSSLAPPPRGPIPNRSPTPNRTPQSSSSLAAPSLAPPPTHSSMPSKPRKKVLLSPNHSPLDWAHLSSSPLANLRGLPPSTPLLRVPPSLLKKFTGRKGKDAWTALGGKVYNITPYLPYHPGGEPELMKCAGRDGTRMFSEVHPWVNWEGMLEACLVGISVGEDEYEGGGALEAMD